MVLILPRVVVRIREVLSTAQACIQVFFKCLLFLVSQKVNSKNACYPPTFTFSLFFT